ncbi:hypothetical protein ANAEL_03225 [Anaerolineales bacterium]|nr:hypothetical protein ANAEL_03225 [Anaerolineales bacterium]
MRTKLILSLTLLTFVLAACGGSPSQTTPEPAAPTQAESQPTMAPAPTDIPPTETALATEPAATEPATEAPAAGGVSFASDVMPIFQNSCIGCHGGDQTRAGLDLKTYDSLMAGSVNGAVVVAGNSGESWLVKLTAEGKMPKRGDKLTPEQIQILTDWITAGALNN